MMVTSSRRPESKQRGCRGRLRNTLPAPLYRWLKRLYIVARTPWARLRIGVRVPPLSYMWGLDRGGMPVHRYYVEQFLQEHSNRIKGRCLEFRDTQYLDAFGGKRVTGRDVIHKDADNPEATIVVDITQPTGIQGNRYDCIICTRVLQYVRDLDAAISEMHRILRPGGSLLVAVPALGMRDPETDDIWRFTAESLRVLLARDFGPENTSVRSYGNSLVAAGEIRGLLAAEFTRKELDVFDPLFAVEICACATKRIRE